MWLEKHVTVPPRHPAWVFDALWQGPVDWEALDRWRAGGRKNTFFQYEQKLKTKEIIHEKSDEKSGENEGSTAD